MPRTTKNLIKVDESDPIGELEPSFPWRDVVIKRNVDIKQFYDLQSEIGRGKFGTVFRCKEKATGLTLAAKFVGIAKRNDRRNVEREVEIMRELQHPRLIQIYDAFESSNVMCVVLELIEGGELFERVIDDDFVLTEKAVTVFMRQICEGVDFIHSKNVLHLDMKPENILCLTKTGNRIKIIDFGLARKFDPEKKLQVLFGTPEFVAPEVVNFDAIGFGTDMWSVGVICYVLLSGLSPFMGETDVQTMSNVTLTNYDFDDECFNEISDDAKDFIRKLLLKDKEARMTAAQCLQHPWLSRHPNPDPNLANSKDNIKECLERWSPEKQMPTLNTKKNLKANSPPKSEKKLKLDVSLKENDPPNAEKRPKHDLTATPSVGGEKKMRLDVETPEVVTQQTSTTPSLSVGNITLSSTHKESADTLKTDTKPPSSPIKETKTVLSVETKPTASNDGTEPVPKSSTPTKTPSAKNLLIEDNSDTNPSKETEIFSSVKSSSSIINDLTKPGSRSPTLTQSPSLKNLLIDENSVKSVAPTVIDKTSENSLSSQIENDQKSLSDERKSLLSANTLVKDNLAKSSIDSSVIDSKTDEPTTQVEKLDSNKASEKLSQSAMISADKKSLTDEKISTISPKALSSNNVLTTSNVDRAKLMETSSSAEKKLKLHPPPTPDVEDVEDSKKILEKKLKVNTPFTPDVVSKSPFERKSSVKSNGPTHPLKDTKNSEDAKDILSKLPETKLICSISETKINNTDLQSTQTKTEEKTPVNDTNVKRKSSTIKLNLDSSTTESKENQKALSPRVQQKLPSSPTPPPENTKPPLNGTTKAFEQTKTVPLNTSIIDSQNNVQSSPRTSPRSSLTSEIKSPSGSTSPQPKVSPSNSINLSKFSTTITTKVVPEDIGLSKLKLNDTKSDQSSTVSSQPSVKLIGSPSPSVKHSSSKDSIPLYKTPSQSQISKTSSKSSLAESKLSNSSLSSTDSSNRTSPSRSPSNPLNIPIISSGRTFQRGTNKLEKQAAVEVKTSSQGEISTSKLKETKPSNEEIIQKISELTEKSLNKSVTNPSERKISVSRQISSEKKEVIKQTSTENKEITRQISTEKKELTTQNIVTVKCNNTIKPKDTTSTFKVLKPLSGADKTVNMNKEATTSKDVVDKERKSSRENLVKPNVTSDKSNAKQETSSSNEVKVKLTSEAKEKTSNSLNVPRIITHKIHIEDDDETKTMTDVRRGSLEPKTNKQKLDLLDEFRQDRRASDISCFFNGEDDFLSEVNRLSDKLKDLKSSSFDNSSSSESLFQRVRRPKYKMSHFSRDVPVNSPPPPSNMTYYMRNTNSQSPGSHSPTNDVLINFLTQFNDQQADAKPGIDVRKKETPAAV